MCTDCAVVLCDDVGFVSLICGVLKGGVTNKVNLPRLHPPLPPFFSCPSSTLLLLSPSPFCSPPSLYKESGRVIGDPSTLQRPPPSPPAAKVRFQRISQSLNQAVNTADQAEHQADFTFQASIDAIPGGMSGGNLVEDAGGKLVSNEALSNEASTTRSATIDQRIDSNFDELKKNDIGVKKR